MATSISRISRSSPVARAAAGLIRCGFATEGTKTITPSADMIKWDYMCQMQMMPLGQSAPKVTIDARSSPTGRSLFGGLSNSFSGFLNPSREMTMACSNFLHQQQRTFIQMRTVLKVVDNSGAKKVMCIQALKGKKGARLGDTIIASVKEAMPNGKVKKGKVVYGVVVRAAMQRGRCDGSEVKFDDNAVVLVDKQGQPIGTRVFGPVPHELRQKKHIKILSLAQHIA
ncbi:50S ribosomal protein HLP, mitochondrial isoform X2 [Carica papaya]|uniref:50S ribosomal protein HLP, mitochondrial isoform X2 n=1 Tax=Carica papaya TaxID=3649 RepID=UPI000B8CFB14|nr:50S ribosomal protein HLP, mitochondrial isoform X2 [Carica papaya]